MPNRNCIHAAGEILISRDVASVFDLFANPANDPLWRTEINESTLDGPLQVGVTVAEYAYLSKKAPNNLLQLQCVQFDKNSKAIFETPGGARFYLKSQRMVKAVAPNTTQVAYQLDFDKSIVRFALGFSLPHFIIAWKANSDMKKYLRQLKKQVERA